MVNQGHQIASIDPTEDKSLMHNKDTREVASHKKKIRLELSQNISETYQIRTNETPTRTFIFEKK